MTEWKRLRRDGRWGPWHIMQATMLSLCGRRLKGLASETRREEESFPPGSACEVCLKHRRAGTRASYRRYR